MPTHTFNKFRVKPQLALALRPKLGAGLAVGVGTAYAAFSTPTAGCAPTTRGSNAGVGAAAASPQAHTGGQNQPDAIHGNQCQVCQDYFANGAAVSTAEVCEHKVCEFCFRSLDSRACVACRREWPSYLWVNRNLPVQPYTRDTSRDEDNLAAAARGSPAPLGSGQQFSNNDSDSDEETQHAQVLVAETDSDEEQPAQADQRANRLYGTTSLFNVVDRRLQLPVALQVSSFMGRENATDNYLPSFRVAIVDGIEPHYSSSRSGRNLGLVSCQQRIPTDVLHLRGRATQYEWGLQSYVFSVMVNGHAFQYVIDYNTRADADIFQFQQVEPLRDPVNLPAGLRTLVNTIPLHDPNPFAEHILPGTVEYLAEMRQNDNDTARMQDTLHDAEVRYEDASRRRRVRRRLNGGSDGN